jgi:hypothetical protein
MGQRPARLAADRSPRENQPEAVNQFTPAFTDSCSYRGWKIQSHVRRRGSIESGEHLMTIQPNQPTTALTNCPQCNSELVVLRVIPGKAGAEYWALRCVRCGGIHLDIVNTFSVDENESA